MSRKLSSFDQGRLRLDLFAWLESRQQEKGFLTWHELRNDYVFEGMHIQLISYRGIQNPQELDETLCLSTSIKNPYSDVTTNGPIHYKFEAQYGNTQGSNKKLRAAMHNGVPLVYFEAIESGKYAAWCDVYVTGENLEEGYVTLDLDPASNLLRMAEGQNELEKSYALKLAKQRVHQPKFRAAVMLAYETQCAVCRLKHGELLDAAHIVADSDSRGVAAVRNGLALCKIHHSAFDKKFIGISPDYEVRVNAGLLLEVDGPMLKHGIQEMHGLQIHTPKSHSEKPDKDLLAIKYDEFIRAA